VSKLELDPDQVHVWLVPLDDPVRKRRRQLAQRAQRQILAAYLAVDPDAIELELGEYGKPRLAGGELRFNLSHSGPVAMLALSRELELGIDIQGPHPATGKPWFAGRVCTARELEQLGPDPKPAELLRLWARKEAVIKARGDLSYVSAGEIDVWDQDVDGAWSCTDIPTAPWPDHHAAVVFPRGPVAVALRGLWDPQTGSPRALAQGASGPG
jgi:4'-phosphopantetheinyl transferase